MSANIAFRSHLMQQFTAAARSQSRPPLALASMPKGRRTNGQIHDSSSSSAARSTKNIPHQAGAASPVTGSLSTGPDGTDLRSLVSQQQQQQQSSPLQRTTTATTNLHTTSVLASSSSSLSDKHETDPSDTESVASSFQTLLMEQTAGYYNRSRSTTTTMTSLLPIPRDTEFWRLALDRAVQSAQQQVSMSMDGPIQLKRILGSSLSLERLGDVVFECALQKHLQKRHHHHSSSKAHAVAAKKRDKWMRIPAYLVALLQGQPNQEQTMVVRKQDNNDPQQQQEDVNPLYQPYQFVPPETEQQLDDYATACAGVQSIMLGLRAQGIGATWTKGHGVLKTPAFRLLVGAKQTDRIVGLVAAGDFCPPPPQTTTKSPLLQSLVHDL